MGASQVWPVEQLLLIYPELPGAATHGEPGTPDGEGGIYPERDRGGRTAGAGEIVDGPQLPERLADDGIDTLIQACGKFGRVLTGPEEDDVPRRHSGAAGRHQLGHGGHFRAGSEGMQPGADRYVGVRLEREEELEFRHERR